MIILSNDILPLKTSQKFSSMLEPYAVKVASTVLRRGCHCEVMFLSDVLTDLNNRGVQDILIASVDGLKGFPEAIKAIFPNTEIQLCIVHQIRNSIRYVASKNQKEFMKDLKLIYQAISKEAAEIELDNLEEKWGKKYPIVIQSWKNKWENLSSYFNILKI